MLLPSVVVRTGSPLRWCRRAFPGGDHQGRSSRRRCGDAAGRARVDSVLCESGADECDERTQDLYVGESNGYWDLTTTRLRYFGGTTNHFNGQSRPLGVADGSGFEPVLFQARAASTGATHHEALASGERCTVVVGPTPPPWGSTTPSCARVCRDSI